MPTVLSTPRGRGCHAAPADPAAASAASEHRAPPVPSLCELGTGSIGLQGDFVG